MRTVRTHTTIRCLMEPRLGAGCPRFLNTSMQLRSLKVALDVDQNHIYCMQLHTDCLLTEQAQESLSSNRSSRRRKTITVGFQSRRVNISRVESGQPELLRVSVPPWAKSSRLQYSHFEVRHVRIKCRRFQCQGNGLSGLHRIDNFVDPQPRSPVSRIRLLVIGALH